MLSMIGYKEGKWARKVLAGQKEDGSWGQFHSMASPYKELTTEQALRRLLSLGFTKDDVPIQQALRYMGDCMAGRQCIPDRREKTPCWDLYVKLMLATWIRAFVPDDPAAKEVADTWGEVIGSAFTEDTYDPARYRAAFQAAFGLQQLHDRIVDFVTFYPIVLLPGILLPEIEARVIRYVLDHSSGIYYVYDRSLRILPDTVKDRLAGKFLGAVELLSRFSGEEANRQLRYVADWLERNRDADGRWDMGAAANDGIYLPLSDSWRDPEVRKIDCTFRIQRLLEALYSRRRFW